MKKTKLNYRFVIVVDENLKVDITHLLKNDKKEAEEEENND